MAVPKEILESSLNLKAIFLGSTSNSYIDLDLALRKNIKVFSIPKYSTNSVAEYFVMMMLDCARKIPLQIKNNNKAKMLVLLDMEILVVELLIFVMVLE